MINLFDQLQVIPRVDVGHGMFSFDAVLPTTAPAYGQVRRLLGGVVGDATVANVVFKQITPDEVFVQNTRERKQCVKAYHRTAQRVQQQTGKEPRTYKVVAAYAYATGTKAGATAYERGLQALGALHPAVVVADRCAGGTTSPAAERVYARLHRKGYEGEGLVVASTKQRSP